MHQRRHQEIWREGMLLMRQTKKSWQESLKERIGSVSRASARLAAAFGTVCSLLTLVLFCLPTYRSTFYQSYRTDGRASDQGFHKRLSLKDSTTRLEFWRKRAPRVRGPWYDSSSSGGDTHDPTIGSSVEAISSWPGITHSLHRRFIFLLSFSNGSQILPRTIPYVEWSWIFAHGSSRLLWQLLRSSHNWN